MSSQKASDSKTLVCRRCEYTTDVLRTSCPHCGGDMVTSSAP